MARLGVFWGDFWAVSTEPLEKRGRLKWHKKLPYLLEVFVFLEEPDDKDDEETVMKNILGYNPLISHLKSYLILLEVKVS